MKKIVFYVFLFVISIILGLSIYFYISLKPINITIYSSKKDVSLTLENLKVYNYKYINTSLNKQKVNVNYRNIENVIESIKSNNKIQKIDNNYYYIIKDKIPFLININIEKNFFEMFSLEVGYDSINIPFVDDLIGFDFSSRHLEYDLKNSVILKNKNFNGLIDFYNKLKLPNLTHKNDIYTYTCEEYDKQIIIEKVSLNKVRIKIINI